MIAKSKDSRWIKSKNGDASHYCVSKRDAELILILFVQAAKCATKNQLTIKGSTEIVAEFFHFSINSILYQRGIYPPEDFSRESKYCILLILFHQEFWP